MTDFPRPFKSQLAFNTFNNKYKHDGSETWPDLCKTLVEDVCEDKMSPDEKQYLVKVMSEMKFIPGGRYLYYAGRPNKYWNNCFLMRAEEDTKEDWANLSWKVERSLMTGGGVGVDYSVYRGKGNTIKSSGGFSSGPVSKMTMINEIGRHVMQGGSRRSALYASLSWKHQDAQDFLKAKDWYSMPVGTTGQTLGSIKEQDFNFPAPLDMTNISLNYDTEWLEEYNNTGKVGDTFLKNTRQALTTGEPGFSFNFYGQENETLRNPCAEVTSEDDSDCCNLGSVNMNNIQTLQEFSDVVAIATKFLLLGTVKAHLPYDKIYKTREKNRRLGLGIMGVHQWLITRGHRYEVVPELHRWLAVYKGMSDKTAKQFADELGVSRPVAVRSIAPTGTISMLADSTSGIEPIFAVGYRRRYLTEGTKWVYEYKVDHLANGMIEKLGISPDKIETSNDLAKDYERRIAFQADVQDYVDMAISSTINLPKNPDGGLSDSRVSDFANVLARYASRLRGFTCYPDGARGGQPLTVVDYKEAKSKMGTRFTEGEGEFNDVCVLTGGGFCGS